MIDNILKYTKDTPFLEYIFKEMPGQKLPKKFFKFENKFYIKIPEDRLYQKKIEVVIPEDTKTYKYFITDDKERQIIFANNILEKLKLEKKEIYPNIIIYKYQIV